MEKSRVFQFNATLSVIAFCVANTSPVFSQSIDRRFPSIRDQLEGRVEQTQLNTTSTANTANTNMVGASHARPGFGSLESSSFDILKGSSSGNILRGSVKETGTQLQGRVEDNDKLMHLLRPLNGDPLHKSVKVLSGQYTMNPLQGRAEDDSFDAALSTNNFDLPMQRMNPRSDNSRRPNLNGNLGRVTMDPGYEWGINGWFINGWAIDGWGIDGWGVGYAYDRRSSISWDATFDRRRVQANMFNPNVYGRMSSLPRSMPHMGTNMQWHVPPVSPMPPAPPRYEEQNILWDTWYQRVSNALYQNWLGRGQQPGEATLKITVQIPRQIRAQIVRCDNQSTGFKQGLLAAVSSLNGSAVLDFPKGSRKQFVTFESAFNAGTNTAAGASSDRRGELEHVYLRKH